MNQSLKLDTTFKQRSSPLYYGFTTIVNCALFFRTDPHPFLGP